MKRFRMMDLQRFAEEPEENNAEQAGTEQTQEHGQESEAGKTFTQEDVDRIVVDRLKREREKYEKQVVPEKIKAFQEEKLPELVEEEIKRRFPEKTPEEKKLAELEQRLEQEAQERKREKLLNMALKEATDKGLPTDLVNFFVDEDEDKTRSNLEMLEGTIKNREKKLREEAVQEVFKRNSRDVDSGPDQAEKDELTREKIEQMTPQEINENWDRIQEFLKKQR